MIGWRRWRKLVMQASTFQMILFAILLHSLISIFIIYTHLISYITDDENWKINEKQQRNLPRVIWNRKSAMNLLSSDVTPQHEISLHGWWMDHAKWDVNVQCFNQKWSLCSKVLSTKCKSDGVRAVYQYLPIREQSLLRIIDINVRASFDELEPQTSGATFGAFVLIKLSDESSDVVRIQFLPNIKPQTLHSANYKSPENKTIASITVMLTCYGFSGTVHFTDVSILPQHETHQKLWNSAEQLIQKCPHRVSSRKLQNWVFKEESLWKANKQDIKTNDVTDLVTLVTQISMDRISILERSLTQWNGPISLVVYIPLKGTTKEDVEWQRLYIQKKLKSLNLGRKCSVTLVYGQSNDGDYPINLLRNIAIKQTETKFLLLLDADFQPSPNFQQHFASVIKHLRTNPKTAFVVPAFEYIELPQKRDNVPQTKEELLQLLHREDPFILPFRLSESAESHRLTDYWKWYRADRIYQVHGYSDKYEPYLVVQNSAHLPLYDERFTGYGMNKVTHCTELFASGFVFYVLSDAWVIHLPHKASSYSLEFLQNPYQRLRNRMERFEFIATIMRKHRLGKCKLK
ncbi:glycosyltransferase-like protein gnt14 [Centruroides vittatus]|uniref:glycosyltransferase-like protein gnt14 n=1 Tax=Centruroides vittatus TaxID=120091 RepID=UPI00350EED90